MFRSKYIYTLVCSQKNIWSSVRRSLSYQTRFIKEEDYDNVMQFMRVHFYPHNPVIVSYAPSVMKEKVDRQSLESGSCIMAVIETDDKEEILAVGLNEPGSKENYKSLIGLIEECRRTGDRYMNYLLVYKKLHEDVRFWDEIAVGRNCLQLLVGGTHSKYRRVEIMQSLAKLAEEYALKFGVNLLKGETTNEFSSNMMLKLGYELVNEVAYADFKDKNGEVLLKVAPPHTHLRLFIKHV